MGPDIAVIGAGIAGASVGAHLGSRTDRSITIFERSEIATETTARSVALFGDYGSSVERRLKSYGRQCYTELLDEEGTALTYSHIGRLTVATTVDGASRLADRAPSAPGFVSYLASDELHSTVILPGLDGGTVEGALYRPHVGTLAPTGAARALIDRATDHGVQVAPNTPVEALEIENGTVTGIEVDGQSRSVDTVVLTAGPWNPSLLESVGLSLPVHHSRAPVLDLEPADPLPMMLPNIAHQESGVYLRGTRDGTVLVGHYPERTDPTRRLDPDMISIRETERDRMLSVVTNLLPRLAEAEIREERIGVRSHTHDGDPIIGWTAIDGLSVIGFNSSGIQLAPGAGRIIAEQVIEQTPTEFYPEVSVSRFADHTDSWDG